MRTHPAWLVTVAFFVLPTALGAQTVAAPKVDFERDVLPILRQNCVGCHGPTQQMNGFRIDRRSAVIRPGLSQIVTPGNSASSRLYLRMIGNEFGRSMPPAGRLASQDIATIKAWIDQGAHWPDALSNDEERLPIDIRAVQMVEALRTGDRRTFDRLLTSDRGLLNARGPEGSSPFMYAAVYGDGSMLTRLIESGADVNRRNDAGATVLMWAVDDLAKTEVLVQHGADVNARSADGSTPLILAAGRAGAAPVVRFLLSKGANPNPNAGTGSDTTPLREAAARGDADVMQFLIDAGASVPAAGPAVLVQALSLNCARCVQLVEKRLDVRAYNAALLTLAAGDVDDMAFALARATDVNVRDPHGRTPLILAAASDLLRTETVRALIARRADVNVKSDTGMTALDYARLHGSTPILDLLVAAGAESGVPTGIPSLKPQPAHSVAEAIARSLPILQRADANVMKSTGCVTCHNGMLTAMTVSLARTAGFAVDSELAARQRADAGAAFGARVDLLLQHIEGGAGVNGLGYNLLGLHSSGYQPDRATDAAVRLLLRQQHPSGHWGGGDGNTRPPHGSSRINRTALAVRGVQLYTPTAMRDASERSRVKAATWLAATTPRTQEERSFRLLGLVWANAEPSILKAAIEDVMATQRSDGGWGDIPSLPSGPYATGMALVALHEAGLPATHEAYRRGVAYLLRTQLADGSWFAKSRAVPIQPYFDAGFPHGTDQWISAAATNWATMALVHASQDPATTARK
jgi:ankyrin repeat protein/mono/diheme cytochrome c family protein